MPSVPLTDAEIKATTGPVVYGCHFSRPHRHAAHYLGWTPNLLERIAKHRAGTGARLMDVIGMLGITFEVVAVWPGDRATGRAFKRRHNGKRLFPICQATARAQRQQGRLFMGGR